jgi:hypothetical protein
MNSSLNPGRKDKVVLFNHYKTFENIERFSIFLFEKVNFFGLTSSRDSVYFLN